MERVFEMICRSPQTTIWSTGLGSIVKDSLQKTQRPDGFKSHCWFPFPISWARLHVHWIRIASIRFLFNQLRVFGVDGHLQKSLKGWQCDNCGLKQSCLRSLPLWELVAANARKRRANGRWEDLIGSCEEMRKKNEESFLCNLDIGIPSIASACSWHAVQWL